jgi:small-conductance mechanosensitive channel
MNTKVKLGLILLIFAISYHCGFAQNKARIAATDAKQDSFLVSEQKHLQDFENARIQDSLRKYFLENKIATLSIKESKQKESLVEELAQLKKQNADRIAQKQHKIDSLRNFVKGFAVVPFLNDTLFSIYSKYGSLSASERAVAIENRIKNLSEIYFFNSDSLLIVPTESTMDIIYRESIIISISENDALWQNTSTLNLAAIYKDKIGKAVIDYKHATSWQTIAKQIGLALLVLLALGTLIYFVGKLFGFTKTKIEAYKDKQIRGIKISNYELFTANSQLKFLLNINTFLKRFLIIVIVYLALPILFSIFPWTKGFADTLIGYFINPLKNIFGALWNYLPNLFTVIVIVFVFRYILKGIKYLKTEIESGALKLPGFYADWANPTFQIVRVLLYAFMFIVIFPYLPGSDSPVFQGVSVFLGVLFTFGSSGSLSNVIAGLVLTYMRAFKIGDRVKIGDITGDIIEKSLLVTRIRTIKNEIISIPNSNVMSSHTINYSSDSLDNGLIMHTTVTIGYDVPWKNIHQALIDAALRTEYFLHEPKPFVLQTSLEDFYVSYQINAYTREPNKQAIIYSQLHQNIQDCCNEAGIEILSPHYRAARDGNMTTIPADYLDTDYKAPSFNINIKKEEK